MIQLMKKVPIIFVLVLAFVLPSKMLAMDGFYLGMQGGCNFLCSHYLEMNHCAFDTGYVFDAVSGFAWRCGCRIEAEVAYRHNNYDLYGRADDEDVTFFGNVAIGSIMANGYYDFNLCKRRRLAAYVGAGIGYDRVHQSVRILGTRFSGSHTGFSGQAMAGLNHFLCDNIVISAEYKLHCSPILYNNYIINHSVLFGVKKFFCF